MPLFDLELENDTEDVAERLERIEHYTAAAANNRTDYANWVQPGDAARVANDVWVDGTLESADFNDLEPGEEEEIARIQTHENGAALAVRSVGVTEHLADLDGDTEDEHVVFYKFQFKRTPADGWANFSQLNGLLPVGGFGNPEEIIPNTYMGPFSAFRILFENRSDDWSNPTTIAKQDMGAQIVGRRVTE